MIAYLAGTILEKTDKSLLVLTSSGVGYEVFLPSARLMDLEKGAAVDLFVQSVVREDAFDLYGFSTFEEREFFGILLSIPKLGPKKALAILSVYAPDQLVDVVGKEDVAAMSRVPGIGKKSGQQIVWDLKHKLKDRILNAPVPGQSKKDRPGSEFADALAGLKNLGYSEDEAAGGLKEIFDAQPDIEASSAIREFLKMIARSKQ